MRFRKIYIVTLFILGTCPFASPADGLRSTVSISDLKRNDTRIDNDLSTRLGASTHYTHGTVDNVNKNNKVRTLEEDECEKADGKYIMIDFSDRVPGEYVTDQYANLEVGGILFSATGADDGTGFVINGPRIFDSINPSSGDFDLGSPNEFCEVNPGLGWGTPYENYPNCEERGNVLIVQEEDTTEPDDNAAGGTIIMNFDGPTDLLRAGLLDFEAGKELIAEGTPFSSNTGDSIVEVGPATGNNGFADFEFDEMKFLRKLEFNMPGGGAITYCELCMRDPPPPEGGDGKEDDGKDDDGKDDYEENEGDHDDGKEADDGDDGKDGDDDGDDGNDDAIGDGDDGNDDAVNDDEGKENDGKDNDGKEEICMKIDFEDLDPGDYVDDQYANLEVGGIIFTASVAEDGSGYVEQGPRIFDSLKPTAGDFDLGSPNEFCEENPGLGWGFPFDDYPNCEPRGNIMIVQETDKPIPDDNAGGGTITLDFDGPTDLIGAGLLDFESKKELIAVGTTYTDGISIVERGPATGNNGFADFQFKAMKELRSVDFVFPGCGAITYIDLCLRDADFADRLQDNPQVPEDYEEEVKEDETNIPKVPEDYEEEVKEDETNIPKVPEDYEEEVKDDGKYEDGKEDEIDNEKDTERDNNTEIEKDNDNEIEKDAHSTDKGIDTEKEKEQDKEKDNTSKKKKKKKNKKNKKNKKYKKYKKNKKNKKYKKYKKNKKYKNQKNKKYKKNQKVQYKKKKKKYYYQYKKKKNQNVQYKKKKYHSYNQGC